MLLRQSCPSAFLQNERASKGAPREIHLESAEKSGGYIRYSGVLWMSINLEGDGARGSSGLTESLRSTADAPCGGGEGGWWNRLG